MEDIINMMMLIMEVYGQVVYLVLKEKKDYYVHYVKQVIIKYNNNNIYNRII